MNKDAPTTTSRPTLSIDWELYGSYLEESDLSDAEQRALIEVLWTIVVTFVDLGLGIHPLQKPCGKDTNWASNLPAEIADMVESEDRKNTISNQDTGGSLGPKPEGSRL